MTRTALMMAMAVLMSAGVTQASQETIAAPPASAVQGGTVIAVAPASPVEGGKVIPAKSAAITDIKEGQRGQVKYHTVNGKMHATQVRVM